MKIKSLKKKMMLKKKVHFDLDWQWWFGRCVPDVVIVVEDSIECHACVHAGDDVDCDVCAVFGVEVGADVADYAVAALEWSENEVDVGTDDADCQSEMAHALDCC